MHWRYITANEVATTRMKTPYIHEINRKKRWVSPIKRNSSCCPRPTFGSCLYALATLAIHYIQRGRHDWDENSLLIGNQSQKEMSFPIKRNSSCCPRPTIGPRVGTVIPCPTLIGRLGNLESGAYRGQRRWAYSRGLGERCRVDKACGWSVLGPCAQMSCCQVAPNVATWTAMMAPTHSKFRIIIITIIISSPCLHTL
jgi:hypothetical protein